MAKKGDRIFIGFICQVCKCQNYLTEKNKANTPEKVTLKKFCRKCRKVTDHKETTKLK